MNTEACHRDSSSTTRAMYFSRTTQQEEAPPSAPEPARLANNRKVANTPRDETYDVDTVNTLIACMRHVEYGDKIQQKRF